MKQTFPRIEAKRIRIIVATTTDFRASFLEARALASELGFHLTGTFFVSLRSLAQIQRLFKKLHPEQKFHHKFIYLGLPWRVALDKRVAPRTAAFVAKPIHQ